MMFSITEAKHVAGTPANYRLIVEFYEPDDAAAPVMVEDFILNLYDETFDHEGPGKSLRQFKSDIATRVGDAIRSRWARAVAAGDSGNLVGPDVTDGEDPQGILARTDVQNLLGRRFS